MTSRRLIGEMSRLRAVTAYRGDGERLVTAAPNGDLKVWDSVDPRNPRLLGRLRQRHRVTAATWNPKATDLLATLLSDGTLSIWRIADKEPPRELRTLHLPIDEPELLDWLPDGRQVACAGSCGAVTVWDALSGHQQTQLLGRRSGCLAMFAEPDNALRLVYQDATIRRTHPLAQRDLTGNPPGAPLTAAAWSATGRLLVTARGGIVEVRDETLAVRWSRRLAHGSLALGWHGDGTIIVADQAVHSLAALDVSGTTRWRVLLSAAPLSLSVANDVIAVGDCGFAPRLLDLRNGATLSLR